MYNSPISGKPMREIDYEGVIIHTCEQTGGELILSEVMSHIVRTRKETFSKELLRDIEGHKPTFGISDEHYGRELICPVCSTPMEVINYAGDTNVIIDRCPGCGAIWLDHEELEHIQAILEHCQDSSAQKLQSIQPELTKARMEMNERLNTAFSGSRFAFVNRLVNRLMGGLDTGEAA